MVRSAFLYILLIATFGYGQSAVVEVGVITSLTGRFAEFGEQHLAGLSLAVEDVNRAGGVKGLPIKLIIEDDTSNQSAALAAADKLLRGDVPLILGAYSSSITNPLAQYLTRQAYPLLIFSSSADSITRPGSPWVFRLNQPSSSYAGVLFDVFDTIRAQGETLDTVALIHGNGAFETSVADAAKTLARERGYNLVATESYDRGVTDFRPVLNRFRRLAPNAVLMVSYAEDSVAIMRQAKEVGLNAKVFAGGAAGFVIPNFIEGAGDAAEFVVTATTWTKDVRYPGAADLYERLRECLGQEPSYHAAQAYAALISAADVLSRAEDFSPEAVRLSLEQTDLQDSAYGPIRFESENGYTNQNHIGMVAQQVLGGEFVTVYPPEAATTDLYYPVPAWDAR